MMQVNHRYIRRSRWGEQIVRRFGRFNWSKKQLWLIGAVIFIFTFIAGHSGAYEQIRLWQQARSLQKAIELERKKKLWLQQEAESLKNDMARIEKEARQEHGMGQADEVIVKVP